LFLEYSEVYIDYCVLIVILRFISNLQIDLREKSLFDARIDVLILRATNYLSEAAWRKPAAEQSNRTPQQSL